MQERLSHMVMAVAREQDVHTNSWAPGTGRLDDRAWYLVLMNSKLREIDALLSAVCTSPYFPMSVVNHCQVLSVLEKMIRDTG